MGRVSQSENSIGDRTLVDLYQSEVVISPTVHLYAWSSYWITGLSVFFVISRVDYVGLVFITLNLKLL